MYVVTEFNKSFSGSQAQQVVKINNRFRDKLLLHHQGSHIRALIIVDLNQLLQLSDQEEFIES
jgi:hypothetical protein